jgi:hypothetical protein
MKYIAYILLLFSLPILAQDIEKLSWKEATISNKIALTIPKADFDKKYKTDSITSPDLNETCGTDTEAKIIHHKGVSYELSNGMLNFRKIDFRKRRNMWLAFENDWFDHTTTIKSFSKTYPDAVALADEYENEDGDIFELITVLPKEDKSDFEWHFYFQEGKLQYIECFLYCD